MLRLTLSVAVLALAGCPKKNATPGPTGPTATPTPQNRNVGETMADAPTQAVPGTLAVRPPCNQHGYLKLGVASGADFTVEVKPDQGCASAGILNASGGNVGDTIEACADSPKNLVGKGEDTTFIAVSETGACAGNTVTLTFK